MDAIGDPGKDVLLLPGSIGNLCDTVERQSVDLLILWETLSTVGHDERFHAIAQCRKVLRPGGRLLIFDNDYSRIQVA